MTRKGNTTSPMLGRRILVTGASGFVGRNLVPLLPQKTSTVLTPSRQDYDLTEQQAVRRLFADTMPSSVIHLAGLVGGILANKRYPAEYFYQNLLMGAFVLHEAWRSGVKKYVTLIGGCSYPALAPNPIAENELWNGYPQPESAAYSLAKRMAVVQAQAYRQQHGFDAIVLLPGNIYGPHDNFDLESSHVIPALIRKFCEAVDTKQEEVVAWGSGRPKRDFVYVEDVCRVIEHAAESYSGADVINISSGRTIAIRELVETVAELCGFEGRIVWDTTKPDGQMEKGFDVTRMRTRLGADCPTPLRNGLARTLAWFQANKAMARLHAPALG